MILNDHFLQVFLFFIDVFTFYFNFFCRLYDLSSDVMQPEQEYYLQPNEPRRSRNASSLCPVDFYFGGDHLWDRFSVSMLIFIQERWILSKKKKKKKNEDRYLCITLDFTINWILIVLLVAPIE